MAGVDWGETHQSAGVIDEEPGTEGEKSFLGSSLALHGGKLGAWLGEFAVETDFVNVYFHGVVGQ